jgi:type II secretory ATPase GspE/PulE/Tfp pilus assembly ATPase PilB-like protein
MIRSGLRSQNFARGSSMYASSRRLPRRCAPSCVPIRRAYPDVTMVDEMRDAETTKMAIEASLTGQLVFSTLHTNSAAERVVRLLDLGVDRFNVADALIEILPQRLARKLCLKYKGPHPCSDLEISELLDEYCAETDLDGASVLARWRSDFASNGVLLLYEELGYEACRAGSKGRAGVYDLLSGTPEVKQLLPLARHGAADCRRGARREHAAAASECY